MTDKKKTYLTPVMKVVVLDQADIIATSGEGPLGNDGAGFQDLEDGRFTW